MTTYIDVPVTTDPDLLAGDAFDYIAALIPGWVPAAGALDTIIVEAAARIAAVLADLESRVPTSVFRFFGPIVNVQPLPAAYATAPSTWTMADDAGYTIPAGTQVAVNVSGDNPVAFRTLASVTVPPGSTATSAGEVVIVAVAAGSAGNLLGAPGDELAVLDALAFVDTAVLTAATSGGADAESDGDYLNRLSGLLTLLGLRPILPRDFVLLARNIAGVDRALALDLYDALEHAYGYERTVTVAVVDVDGNDPGSTVRGAVATYLQALREANFVVYVIAATYTDVDVDFAVTVYKGYDPTDVHDRAVAAVTAYLSPANWGLPRVGDQRDWLQVPFVRYLELATLLNNVEGVDEVIALTLARGGGTLRPLDVSLDGPAPMPQPGTITGTAV